MTEQLPYDAWLHWNLTDRCNLQCSYCIGGIGKRIGPENKSMKKIDVTAFLRTLDATDKIFLIGFTGGGEPFVMHDFVGACVEISKKHYLQLNTNLTLPAIRNFAEKIDPSRVKGIHASFHTWELRKRNLFDKFIEYYLLCKEKGFNVSAVAVAHPSLVPEVETLRKELHDRGVHLTFIPYIGTFDEEKYPSSYTDEELGLFGLQRKYLKNYNREQQICNAGYNVAVVTMQGDVRPCNSVREHLGNVYSNIRFKPTMMMCPYNKCGCPLNHFDPYLFAKAKEDNSIIALNPLIKRLRTQYYVVAKKLSVAKYISLPRVRKRIKRKYITLRGLGSISKK
ncbi:MAG: hypothetical protein BBJ57_04405 [Desulfobacterales bacterium PC51MH44]|nr:MAG: hypothetical protein BBJ57_04405 [Desulfobacterales bacterium PC51MH44]